ncbi:MT-A70-domain-containing protein [Parasitella parasitica]|nr:MT-A70-domain-containing protein [Parasitella parasitica]
MNERPKRKRRQITANANVNSTKVSNAYYVGYVEDAESVDAIMKKFEELDRIQQELSSSLKQAAGSSQAETEQREQQRDSQLTQAQLEEVFRCTSAFTIKRASLNSEHMNAMDLVQVKYRSDSVDESIEEDEYYDLTDDFGDLDDGDEKYNKRSSKTSRKKGLQQNDRQIVLSKQKILGLQTKDLGRKPIAVKKRVCDVDPSLPTYVKIPSRPIKVSWAHSIKPLSLNTPPTEFRYYEIDHLVSQDLAQYGSQFQGIYMDPPLRMAGETSMRGKVDIEDFAKMNIPKIIEAGFLFIWLEKEWEHKVIGIARDWGFKYVENYCWIKKNINNTIYKDASNYFCKSKLNLLIFKKEHDKRNKVEIRHQRNADCVFDFVRPLGLSQLTETKPAHVYNVIETLLPASVQDSKLLELWARKNTQRQGWTTIVDLY